MIKVLFADGSVIQVLLTTIKRVSPRLAEAVSDEFELDLGDEEEGASKLMIFYIMEERLPENFAKLDDFDLEGCIKCWVMCEGYGIPSLYDKVMRVLLQEAHHKTPINLLASAVGRLKTGSKMRLALIKEFVLGIRRRAFYLSIGLERFEGVVGFLTEYGMANHAPSQHEAGHACPNETTGHFMVKE